jgi:ribosomal protein L29
MTKLKFKEIREMDQKNIDLKISELKMEYMKAISNSANTNNSKAKEIRRTIARLKTKK